MPDKPKGPELPQASETESDPLLSWRRIGEFVRNILRIERSVEALKKENQEFEQRVSALQRQVDEQAGQLRVLLEFVNKALDERVASRAEEAAIKAFERMAALTGPPAGRRPERKDESP